MEVWPRLLPRFSKSPLLLLLLLSSTKARKSYKWRAVSRLGGSHNWPHKIGCRHMRSEGERRTNGQVRSDYLFLQGLLLENDQARRWRRPRTSLCCQGQRARLSDKEKLSLIIFFAGLLLRFFWRISWPAKQIYSICQLKWPPRNVDGSSRCRLSKAKGVCGQKKISPGFLFYN